MDLQAPGLKIREISQGCAVWGFIKKIFTPPPLDPTVRKFYITNAAFSLKTLINIGESATKICDLKGNSPWAFWGKKNCTRSRIYPLPCI